MASSISVRLSQLPTVGHAPVKSGPRSCHVASRTRLHAKFLQTSVEGGQSLVRKSLSGSSTASPISRRVSSFEALRTPYTQQNQQPSRTLCRARNKDFSQEAKLREEVTSPFRTVRMFFYLGFMGSAGLGALVVGVRLLAALAGAPGDDLGKSIEESLKDFGIDVAALAVFAVLYRIDAKAKNAQLAKLDREESLSQLRVELATGRMVKVAQLRGSARLVIVAGPLSHVQRALALAEPLKQQLLERGVTVVPFVTEEDVPYSSTQSKTQGGKSQGGPASGSSDFKAFVSVIEAEAKDLPKGEEQSSEEGKKEGVGKAEERWLARPLYTNEWEGWLKEQLKFANIEGKTPVYLSLRLDGRVRGSGVGFPRWQVIAAQLPPMKGIWQGPFDGMDGRVL